jgi:hypothetical protein
MFCKDMSSEEEQSHGWLSRADDATSNIRNIAIRFLFPIFGGNTPRTQYAQSNLIIQTEGVRTKIYWGSPWQR